MPYGSLEGLPREARLRVQLAGHGSNGGEEHGTVVRICVSLRKASHSSAVSVADAMNASALRATVGRSGGRVISRCLQTRTAQAAPRQARGVQAAVERCLSSRQSVTGLRAPAVRDWVRQAGHFFPFQRGCGRWSLQNGDHGLCLATAYTTAGWGPFSWRQRARVCADWAAYDTISSHAGPSETIRLRPCRGVLADRGAANH